MAADSHPDLVKSCVVDQGLGRSEFIRRRFAVSKRKKSKQHTNEDLSRKRLVVKKEVECEEAEFAVNTNMIPTGEQETFRQRTAVKNLSRVVL